MCSSEETKDVTITIDNENENTAMGDELFYYEHNGYSELLKVAKKTLCLVFPKLFEYSKFIYSIGGRISSIIILYSDPILHLIRIDDHNSFYLLFCLVINDSDIGFLLKFNDFLKNESDWVNKMIFMLVGTCGVHSKSEVEVGQTHYITKATKIDRGDLRGLKLHLREDKMSTVIISGNDVVKAIFGNHEWKNVEVTHCSNQLILSWEDNKLMPYPTILFDMETYDFFSICQHHDVEVMGALRVTSDIVGGGDQTAARLSMNFNQVVVDIFKILKLCVFFSNDFEHPKFEEQISEGDQDKETSVVLDLATRCLLDKISKYWIKSIGQESYIKIFEDQRPFRKLKQLPLNNDQLNLVKYHKTIVKQYH